MNIFCLLANYSMRGERVKGHFSNFIFFALNNYQCIISNNKVIKLENPISVNIGARMVRFFSNRSFRFEKGKYFGAVLQK